MAQIYDHFVYKPVDNYDLSLNMTDPNAEAYMSGDQTFHTPSFGDEEFEIPPLNLPTTADAESNCHVYNHQSMNHHEDNQMDPPPCSQTMGRPVMTPTSSSHTMTMIEPQYPHHRPHNVYVGQMGVNEQIPPHSLHVQIQSYDHHPIYSGGHIQSQSQSHMQAAHLHMMPPQNPIHNSPIVNGHSPMLNQSQTNGQMGAQISPMSGSPPGSTHTSPGFETSEDSDDSTPLTQLIGGIKRPSPEPIDSSINRMTTHKKPKVQKKKKKRDPNEPQKPVSAYALFFRDTQAAIKGQNPNASFGEVSKIVASMWDSLDADHKNLYKKKTEAAKKEYLKALAAYRASLVSKQAAADQSDVMYGNSVSPTSSSATSPVNSSPGHVSMLSPLQKKSPLLTSLMEGNSPLASQLQQQQQHPVVPGQMWRSISNMYFTVPQPVNNNHPMSHHSMGQMLHPQSNQMLQQQQIIQPQGVSQSMNSSSSYTVMSTMATQNSMPGSEVSRNCLRNNIETTQWEQDYPNNDCVITHCSRDAFNSWLEPRPPQNTYASVK
ncbi:TOX high mobility group box family member 2-like isoform X1 [Centruroides vittatus]|uniref:TOX high mobility group box family member 2-like isoform X1 n=2 Tax=Centruroides vittatus TaxID=120091 RepID=UPI00350F2C61